MKLSLRFYRIFVSIHSLTQRETPPGLLIFVVSPCFNPLPHAEGDSTLFVALLIKGRFNPLPHAEGDCAGRAEELPLSGFNPLPHAEGDVSQESKTLKNLIVSIHSLTQRETATLPRPDFGNMFQSTPSRRGRPLPRRRLESSGTVSIHSLTQRETQEVGAAVTRVEFQSTPSRRGRLTKNAGNC